MSRKYVLIEKKPYPVSDVIKWGKAFEKDSRRVAKTQVGNVDISTVFLGIDHGWGDNEEPILFETMAFDTKGDEKMCWRYATWDEAVKGHWLAVLIETTGGTYG